ncbi:uncharacterized protein si:ch211-276i12.4 [Gambusia affinis]|uniref:uncharacterized protein si:ch211-276i12.4 n=1 Tax=Gambusia affinis TaxID=33528 RepID=UPI001CDC9EEF|nr:uncharacterized protein si:ch211-276i12.4 [Gambusia affinis]
MDKFFKPVHGPSSDQTKKQRNHLHHHHQDTRSQRYTKLDDSDRHTDDSRGHHGRHQYNEYLYDTPHTDAQYLYHQDIEKLYDHRTSVTLSRASSSSLSSTSSSSSTSWYTETSVNDPFSLQHAERPQHSLSCSNISDVRRAFRDDDSSEPIVFATVKHSKRGNIVSRLDDGSQQSRRNDLYDLNRGHSRSEERLLQCNEVHGGRVRSKVSTIDHGPLYKTTSLNRSLAFSEEDILLGVPRGPKRAVSSSQLPSKGILKNKESNNDIRKAKSMEVLSPRVNTGEGQSGQKGKGITQAEIEQARANFVEGKLQFSAFLDEITKQVMSPSQLSIFGVNTNKTTEKTHSPGPKPEPVKPELPPKKHRAGKWSDTELPLKHHSRQVKPTIDSRKHSDCSDSDKLTTYAARKHRGSPPPRHYTPSASQGQKDTRPSPTGDSFSGDKYGRYGPHHTDGTSTSPEPAQPKLRHPHKYYPSNFQNQNPHTQHFPMKSHHEAEHGGPSNSPPHSSQLARQGFGSESSSTKSDSSRGRDTASTATSYSSEQGGQYQSQPLGISKQHRNVLCNPDHLQALQEENADLHQNLLQTVVCIESLEAELQRTRDELSHVKEKHKSLLQTHSGTKEANNLLGEHLQSESLSSERKFLLNRVSQLGSELNDAHRTIAALENINVPVLVKELLEKYFGSAEAIQHFLTTSFPTSQSQQTDGQSCDPKAEEAAQGCLSESEAGRQRVTAFMPIKQPLTPAKNEGNLPGQHESAHSPSFSLADMGAVSYKTTAPSYAARPQPVYPQTQQQLLRSAAHTDTAPDPPHAHAAGDRWEGRGGLKVLLFEQDAGDVNSMSAQQILDDFMHHLQAHKEAGGGKEQQSGQEWMNGVEQAGKVGD